MIVSTQPHPGPGPTVHLQMSDVVCSGDVNVQTASIFTINKANVSNLIQLAVLLSDEDYSMQQDDLKPLCSANYVCKVPSSGSESSSADTQLRINWKHVSIS
jgi:hypothetical protein